MWNTKFIVVGFLAALADAPPPQVPADEDSFIVSKQRFMIPVSIDEKDVEKTKEVRLFFSRDKGKTWKLHSQVSGRRVALFSFKAPEIGLYWFALQTKSTDGILEPKSIEALTPGLKVKVSFKIEKPTWTKEDEDKLQIWRSLLRTASKENPNYKRAEEAVADLEARKKAAKKR